MFRQTYFCQRCGSIRRRAPATLGPGLTRSPEWPQFSTAEVTRAREQEVAYRRAASPRSNPRQVDRRSV
jgi:hypothetical protein